MKLILSLSVLAVALLMVLEGPAPAQAESGIMDDLKELGSEMVKKVQNTLGSINWKWLTENFDKVKETIKSPFS